VTGPPPADIPEEQQRIRARCVHPAGTFVGFGADELEQSIPARFERQVRRYPERLAVKTRSHRLSYAELNRAANRVARAILTRRGEGNEPVAVLLDQGAAAAAAMLGVLKAGKIYVPLDPAFPAARLAYMLGDSGAELVLTSADHLTLAEASGARGGRALDVDALIDWRGEPKASRAKHGNAVETSAARSRPTLDEDHAVGDLGAPISPDALAYIVYTSGSTGQPKGIVQNHRNVLHKVMTPTNDFHICPDDRLALLYGAAVAIGVRISLCAWLNGAALYPIALKSAGVAGLAAWLVEEGITVYHSVATVFRHFVDALTGAEEFPDLRLIFVTGEAVYPREIQAYQARFAPDCVFVHGFGLAELSHVRQYYVDRSTPVQGGIVPVGYAVDGVEVRLLNEAGTDTSPGQIGEIALESPFVTVGYWRKPELDRAAFLPDPAGGGARIYRTGDLGRMRPDGCLEHLGRKDFQMKVRGYTIEAAEVEGALLECAAIKEAAVVTRADRRGEPELVAYLVPAGGPPPSVGALRRALAETLPDYMLPAVFVVLDALPLTPTGKVDRRALPAVDEGARLLAPRPPFVTPRTPVERALGQIWADVLRLDRVGVHEGFLDLGGHSLLATQIASRVHDAFRVTVPLPALLEASTVADMAVVIAEHMAGKVDR
jgi:amino acid adenylation domain-containing protein